jgi:hypothetical protein
MKTAGHPVGSRTTSFVPWTSRCVGSYKRWACSSSWVVMALLYALLPGLRGAEFEAVVARSTSGQFVVRGLPQGPLRSSQSTSEVNYLRLDPSLTAVSLERIRQSLYGELNLPDTWRGPVRVSTFPAQEDSPPITVTSIHYKDGWEYRVEMPEIIEKPRFVRCAVNVILREFANRSADTREAELPPWLTEGLASELEATSLPSLALEPTTTPPGLVRVERGHDPLRQAREVVRSGGLLTFTQLSLPTDVELSGANRLRFQACSHLFVRELLRLHGGREALRNMLERLPQYLNWQTAFLRAFETRFPRLIDLDKWYTLTTTHVSGRDNTSVWPLDTTLSRLDEILSTTVQVRSGANDLPLSAPVSLQRVLGELEPSKQIPVLELKRLQLEMLLGRAAPELAGLIVDYLRAIDASLRQSRAAAGRRNVPAGKSVATPEMLRTLDGLDRRLNAIRTKLPANSSAMEKTVAPPP